MTRSKLTKHMQETFPVLFTRPIRSWTALLVPFLVFCYVPVTFAQSNEPARDQRDETKDRDHRIVKDESYNSGWALFLDNDLIALGSQDDQYTGGFALVLSGRRAKSYPWSLDPILGGINDLLGVDQLYQDTNHVTRHSFELGSTAFTPDDISQEAPIEDDHPYASLVFMSNTRQTILPDENVSYLSTFSLGVLGTSVARETQTFIHDMTGSEDPQGWDNQISDGGEPTLLYTLIREDQHIEHRTAGFGDFDLRTNVGGSLGYITQLQAGFNWRWGSISTPHWTFHPDYAEFLNLGSPVAQELNGKHSPSSDLFLWGGFHLRARGYNALIQGQFRDSEVTIGRGELREFIGEASFGVTSSLNGGSRITLGIHARTPEIIEAEGNRPIWISLMFSQSY